MTVWRLFRHGLRVGTQDFRYFWTWRSWIFGWILRVITSALTWVLLGRLVGDPSKVTFLLLGSVVIAGPNATCWAIPACTWDRADGTYPLLVIAPSSIFPSMLGRTSIWCANGLLTSLMTFLVLGAMFDLQLSARTLLGTPPIVAVVCISSYCFALFVGAVAARAPKLRMFLNNMASSSLFVLCGTSVPIGFWPEWLQTLVQALPVTHGIASMRLLFENGQTSHIAAMLARELAVGAGWLTLSILVMDRLAAAACRDGELELT